VRGGESRDLFELIGEMRYTAVVHLIGYLSQIEFVVHEELFDPLYLVLYDIMLDRDTRDLGE
jgi:hypothetical protein